jgi:hypothetical protein
VLNFQDFFFAFPGLHVEVERDPFCKRILTARMTEGSLDKCPIYDDVTSFVPTSPASGAEAVSAGWPWQVAASVSTRWHGWFVNFFNPLAIL